MPANAAPASSSAPTSPSTAAKPSIAGTAASAGSAAHSQIRMRARSAAARSSPPATPVAIAAAVQDVVSSAHVPATAWTSSPTNTRPRPPTASAEDCSRRRASSHAPPRNTSVTSPMMMLRTVRSARSGLKKVNTIAATANRPAPAVASTDCRLAPGFAACCAAGRGAWYVAGGALSGWEKCAAGAAGAV
ncbi:hypothetical protein DY023_02745 [Microbacterium bovistercoris]|uniref:Uncharacterized protein n=1 Tax=Microbacterium bovistercoris TaxID=2293570 RepID=A0A371NZ69_9MICO|nr:hypothetical protein DY023_02745 [Microbacterium bovistercoris]